MRTRMLALLTLSITLLSLAGCKRSCDDSPEYVRSQWLGGLLLNDYEHRTALFVDSLSGDTIRLRLVSLKEIMDTEDAKGGYKECTWQAGVSATYRIWGDSIDISLWETYTYRNNTKTFALGIETYCSNRGMVESQNGVLDGQQVSFVTNCVIDGTQYDYCLSTSIYDNAESQSLSCAAPLSDSLVLRYAHPIGLYRLIGNLSPNGFFNLKLVGYED